MATPPAITNIVVHPQWGVPMEYHKLVRAEADIQASESFVTFASYYNKGVHDADGMSMTMTTARIPQAIFNTEKVLLQAVIAAEGNPLSGGKIVVE